MFCFIIHSNSTSQRYLKWYFLRFSWPCSILLTWKLDIGLFLCFFVLFWVYSHIHRFKDMLITSFAIGTMINTKFLWVLSKRFCEIWSSLSFHPHWCSRLCNASGYSLLDLCFSNNLLISNRASQSVHVVTFNESFHTSHDIRNRLTLEALKRISTSDRAPTQ